MKVTGVLSRVALKDNLTEISHKEMNYFVHFVISSLPLREKTRQKLSTETAKNDTLQKLHQMSAGWLEHRLKLDPCQIPYHHHNPMITYQDGLLLKGQKNHNARNTPMEMHKILH